MPDKYILHLPVAYGAVDREEMLTLRGVFALLQEAAIAHANECGAGTSAASTRAEAWVLKRMAAEVDRYPHYGEMLRLETWSSGIRGAKGYREFRVFAGVDEPIARGSSVWVYVNLRTRSVTRVPPEVASGFPSAPEGVYCPGLEDLDLAPPDPATAAALLVSLRYSDVDALGHVNNTAYYELLQTALARRGRPIRPKQIRIRYGKGIPGDMPEVEVRLGLRADGTPSAFSFGVGDAVYAQGDVA